MDSYFEGYKDFQLLRQDTMRIDRKTLEKEVKYRSHFDFINTCIAGQLIPKGFRIKFNLNLNADEEIRRQCEKIKLDTSLQLMNLAAKACEKQISKGWEVDRATAMESQLTEKFRKRKAKKIYNLKKEKLAKSCIDSPRGGDIGMHVNRGGLVEENVKADGNCFFRCISKHIHQTEDKHNEVRAAIMNHIKSNRDTYQKYVDGDMSYHIQECEHTDGRQSSWATECEIQAAACTYGMTIHIRYISALGREDVCKFLPNADSTWRDPVTLLLKSEHFVLLVPVNQDKVKNSRQQWDWFDMAPKGDGTGDYQQKGEEGSAQVSERQEESRGQEVEKTNRKIEADKPCKNVKSTYKGIRKNSREKNRTAAIETKGTASRTMAGHVVTNLSSKTLSVQQESLLRKGLSYVPTRENIDTTKLLTDLAEWERRMRLREYFYKEGEHQEMKEEVPEWKKKKSNFTPEQGRSKWLDAYIDAVKDDIVSNLQRKIQMNISKEEQRAMKELLHDQEIVIRPADKGSGIVVVDREDYIKELEKEVQGNLSYEEIDCKKLKEVDRNIKKLANRMHKDGHIDSELKAYLVPKYPRAGRLKGNPKLHKKAHPYRAIVNGRGTHTERMAGIAERQLEEYVVNSPSYIKDTTDFLQHLRSVQQPLPSKAVLFCFDIVKLYPSVPRKEGREACIEALEERTDKGIPAQEVLDMIDMVLEQNIFTFNDKHYVQKKGVAIGSKLGKNYACAYMRKFDEKLMENEEKPFFYKRFIDDGFGIWTGGEEALERFHQHANNIHEDIKVEMRWNKERIEFLDTWVEICDGKLETDLYTKPTDRHLYVQAASSHPSNTKRAIPYGLGIRIKRICSREQDYVKHRDELKKQLRKRGYSSKFLEKQLSKVDKLKREDLLRYKEKVKKNDERVPMVLTYSRQLPDIHRIVYKHLPVLHRSERLKKAFEQAPLVAFRRDRNIGDILVHGKLNRTIPQYNRDKCDDEDCSVCTRMSDTEITSTDGVLTFSVKLHQQCKTENVVYGITCGKCSKIVYIGETERRLRDRIKEHLADVRHQREKAVARHFNDEEHAITDFGVVILEKIIDNSKYYRLIKEKEWIDKLKTEIPKGLNKKTKLGVLWREY